MTDRVTDLWGSETERGYYGDFAESLIEYTLAQANLTPNHGKVCLKGRAGYSSNMCGWYGSHDAYYSHWRRLEPGALKTTFGIMLAKSVEHWAEQFMLSYFGLEEPKASNNWKPGIRYKPTGEYVIQHGEPGVPFIGRDSDSHRHDGGYGRCRIAADETLRSVMKAPEAVDEALRLNGWWLSGYSREGGPAEGVSMPIEGGKHYSYALGFRTLAGLFLRFRDIHYLRLASAGAVYHFRAENGRDIPTSDADNWSKTWAAFDTGRRELRLGGGITGLGGTGLHKKKKAPAEAELTIWPWYQSDWVVTMWRIVQAWGTAQRAGLASETEAKHWGMILGGLILSLTDWMGPDRMEAPLGDAMGDGAGDYLNHFVQGWKRSGSGSSLLLTGDDGRILTLDEVAEAWRRDESIRVATTVEYCNSDGRYWQRTYTDGDPATDGVERMHHQYRASNPMKPPSGPKLNNLSNDGSRMGDACYIRSEAMKLLGFEGWERWRQWSELLIHSTWAYAGINNGEFEAKRSDRHATCPTSSANGRFLAWMAANGVVAAEAETGVAV